MKILLGNNTLSLLAGSETWTYTLALALKKAGHNVACYSPDLGIISDKLAQEDIPSYRHMNTGGIQMFSPILEESRDHDYDVIIANHWHIVAQLRNRFPKTPIMSTIHGIIHHHPDDKEQWAPEHPAMESGVNQFIAVSEEVQALLKQEYNIESEIVRNFIDIKRYGSLPEAKKKPEQFLINTNYLGSDDPPVKLIRDTAKLMGAKVAAIGVNFSPNFHTEIAIKDSDVVFGMGRSVLEGMAAGRLGVVLGRWGHGGVVNKDTVEAIRMQNFSGRNAETNELPTPEQLAEEIKKNYNQATLDWTKEYIKKDHNAAFAAEKIIRMAKELTGEAINKPTGAPPGARKMEPLNAR